MAALDGTAKGSLFFCGANGCYWPGAAVRCAGLATALMRTMMDPIHRLTAPANSRHQNEPAPYFTSCYLLVGREPFGERPTDHSIEHLALEDEEIVYGVCSRQI